MPRFAGIVLLFGTYLLHSLPVSIAAQTTNGNSYGSNKNEVLTVRTQLKTIQISTDSLSVVFTKAFTEKLLPHWLGTPWSFEGHTSIPRQGEIACGYFVSTTLLHMGFNLDRYKFAQQLPIHEAKTLCPGGEPLEIYHASSAERIRTLQDTLEDGIYFIGFDRSHVGYIQKKNGQLYVIHSNYIRAEGVVIEEVSSSEVFAAYDRLFIAEISTNRALMGKWLSGERIEVNSP